MDNKNICVLLVEDNPADARLVRELLVDVGAGDIRLLTAGTLATGIELISRESIDLVLLDLTLPDSFGLASLSAMLAQAPAMPVVVLTGMADENMAREAIHLGAEDYLTKGDIEGYRLAQVIRYALERKKNQRELQLLKNRYLSILTSVNEGVCVVDVDGLVSFINPAGCSMLGYRPEELLGLNLHTQVHYRRPDGSPYPIEECPYYGTMQNGTPCHFQEDTFWRKDGSGVSVEVNASPIFDGERITGTVIAFRDIGMRLQTEKVLLNARSRLLEREYFLRRVMDNIPQHLLWKDRNSVFGGCNRVAAQSLGLTDPEQIVGKTDFDLHTDPAVAAYHRTHDNAVMDSDRAEYHQIRLQADRDGKPSWLDVSKIPLHNLNGEVNGLLISYEDITARKRMEIEREHLTSVIDASPDMIATAGIDEKLTFLNKGGRTMTGIGADEDVSRLSIKEFHPADDYRRIATEAIPAAIEHGTWHGETLLLTRDGREIAVSQVIIAHRDERGELSYFSTVMRDISPLKQTETALKQLNETLAQHVDTAVRKARDAEYLLIQQSRHAAMGEMIGNIAHQWRQPLNALSLLISNISLDFQDGGLNQPVLDEYVETANRLVKKMSITIDDFRNFFSPNKQPEKFSLHRSLNDTLLLLEASLKNNHIEVAVGAGGDLYLWGYPNEFGQVLLNILANAKEAFAERKVAAPRIEINYAESGGEAEILIRDNAGGIPGDNAAKIFDPYFTTKHGGTGIGLYMSKTIVENNMKGRLSFRNGAEGAEFTINIPLAETQETNTWN